MGPRPRSNRIPKTLRGIASRGLVNSRFWTSHALGSVVMYIPDSAAPAEMGSRPRALRNS